MVIEMNYVAHEPISEPEFGLAIIRQDGINISGPNTHLDGVTFGTVEGPGSLRYRIDKLPLLPARYQITAAIHDSRLQKAYDYHERAYPFRVVGGEKPEMDGAVELPASWEWQPS